MAGRRSLPVWARGGLLLILLVATVQSCAGAWGLATADDADCPVVADIEAGRAVDYECTSGGDGGSRGSAILVLVTIGMVCAVGAVYGLPGIVRDLRGPRGRSTGPQSPGPQSPAEPAEDSEPQLADDLADLDDLHHRGLLTAEELRAARDRRLDRD